MTFLLHLPYSNVVGVILAQLDTSFGLLGSHFFLLAHSRVGCEQNKLFIFFKQRDACTSLCAIVENTRTRPCTFTRACH